jgi:radical SAM-linked protein
MTTELSPLALRCRFFKKGPIRFISHLDLSRAFHRAFIRAGIPLKFSEGFSPHPKFSLALPLSVGTESEAEIADFTLKPGFEISKESLKQILQANMPKGIEIQSIEEQGKKFSEIAFASYEIFLPKADFHFAEKAKEALSGEIVIRKKNKKGKWVEKEISGGIHSLSFSEKEGALFGEAILSASGESYLKPETVLDVLAERIPELNIKEKRILRKAVFCSDLTLF